MLLQLLFQRLPPNTPIKSTAQNRPHRDVRRLENSEFLTTSAWKKYRSCAYIHWKISMISPQPTNVPVANHTGSSGIFQLFEDGIGDGAIGTVTVSRMLYNMIVDIQPCCPDNVSLLI